MSGKLLKFFGNAERNPARCLQRMNEGGFEYVTWVNEWTNDRFLAKKSYIEKKVNGTPSNDESEVVKIGSDINLDEMLYELDAANKTTITIKEGLGKSKEYTRDDLSKASEVMYNECFDYSKLFQAVKQ